MKKSVFIKIMAVVFTFVCVGSLQSMERTHIEIKGLILTHVNQASTLQEAVKNIKALNLTSKEWVQVIKNVYGNEFNQFARVLANEFKTSSYEVAKEWGTPEAKEYMKVSDELGLNKLGGAVVRAALYAPDDSRFQEVKRLLDQGANPNPEYAGSGGGIAGGSILASVVSMYDSKKSDNIKTYHKELIKLLIKYGAKDKNAYSILQQKPEPGRTVTGVGKGISEDEREELRKLLDTMDV